MKVTLKLALLFALIALMAPVAQAELIGHWTFDEGSGTTALDSSGKGYDLTQYNGPTYVAGQIGSYALHFAGASYAGRTYTEALALAGTSYTVAWWQKRETGNVAQGVIGTSIDTEVTGWSVYNYTKPSSGYEDGTTVLVHGSGASNTAVKFSSSLAVTDPTSWAHIALVYDKAASARTLYVNGTAVGGAIATAVDVADGGLGLTVGLACSNYFKGAIDDVQIYNQALTASEVGTVKNGGTIPEPSTFILLSIALLSLLAYAWRRRK